jgi:hypothetical protein
MACPSSIFLDKNMRYIGKSQVKTSRVNEGQPLPQRGDVGARASVGASGLRQRRRRRRRLRGRAYPQRKLSPHRRISVIDSMPGWAVCMHACTAGRDSWPSPCGLSLVPPPPPPRGGSPCSRAAATCCLRTTVARRGDVVSGAERAGGWAMVASRARPWSPVVRGQVCSHPGSRAPPPSGAGRAPRCARAPACARARTRRRPGWSRTPRCGCPARPAAPVPRLARHEGRALDRPPCGGGGSAGDQDCSWTELTFRLIPHGLPKPTLWSSVQTVDGPETPGRRGQRTAARRSLCAAADPAAAARGASRAAG